MIRLRGTALHRGETSTLSVSAAARTTLQGAFLDALEVVRRDQGVAVRASGEVVDLVEHAFAALGGLSVTAALVVEGGEVPLLDGGAAEIARALEAERAEACDRRRRVTRSFDVDVSGSRYRFEPAATPVVEVAIAFEHPAIGSQRARWEGDRRDFVERVATARTFGFLRDHRDLLARGRARGASLDALLVFDERGVAPGCESRERDEPARHKLLDLVGDLELTGGVPLGVVRAERPGHGATHAAIAAAVREGALAPS